MMARKAGLPPHLHIHNGWRVGDPRELTHLTTQAQNAIYANELRCRADDPRPGRLAMAPSVKRWLVDLTPAQVTRWSHWVLEHVDEQHEGTKPLTLARRRAIRTGSRLPVRR